MKAVADIASAGQRHKREVLAQLRKYPRVEQCHLFGVSLFATAEVFAAARATWLERLELEAVVMDATGARTPEQAFETLKAWKARADKNDQLRAELEALKGSLMQTEDETESDARVATKRLQQLEQKADEATAEARRWATAFEREPTPEGHTNAAVAAQRAKNALAAVEAQREQLSRLKARQRKREQDELAQAYRAKHAETVSLFEGAGRALVEAVRSFDDALRQLAALQVARQAAVAKNVPFGDNLQLEEFVRVFNGELGAVTAQRPQDNGTVFANAVYANGENTIAIHLRRPTTAIPRSML